MSGASIDEIVSLIEGFYSNSMDVATVAQSQVRLQSLQKQDDALVLADVLLSPENKYSMVCQFFGALTYTVKLNQMVASWGRVVIDEETLGDEDETLKGDNVRDDEEEDNSKKVLILNEILMKHSYHLTYLLNNYFNMKQNNLFVIRKVFSNLSLIYTYNFKNWTNPLLTLLQTLSTFQPLTDVSQLQVSVASVTDQHQLFMGSLGERQEEKIELMLLFSQIIVEDILKKNSVNDQLEEELHRALKTEVYVVTQYYIDHVFEANVQRLREKRECSEKTTIEAVKCFSAWTSYVSYSHLNSTERFELDGTLRCFVEFLVAHVTKEQLVEDGELISMVLEYLTNLLETNANLVHKEFRQVLNDMIFGPWGMNYLNYLGNEDEKAIHDLSRLIVAYFELDMIKMSLLLINDDYNYIFEMLVGLTSYKGMPIVEEEISCDFIEFWLEVSDYLIDDSESLLILVKTPENLDLFKSRLKMLLLQVSRIYWQKIQLPFADKAKMAEVEHVKEEYLSYRRDVADLYDTIHPILKDVLVKTLMDNITENLKLGYSKVSEMEASLYLMNVIFHDDIEILAGDLKYLFDKTPFLQMSLEANNAYLMTTTVNFLKNIMVFYKSQDPKYLHMVLDYLFNLLATPNSHELAVAKAICSICNNCRALLAQSVEKFEPLVIKVVENMEINSFVREKIINSISCIIQSIKNPADQGKYLYKLILFLNNQSVQIFSQLKPTEPTSLLLDYLTSLLNCLGEIAKGTQLPDEVVLYYTPEERAEVVSYWKSDPLGVHNMILEIISLYSLDPEVCSVFINNHHNSNGNINNMINYHTQIVEKCCSIFKVGLCEDIDGPFVFDEEVIVNYFLSKFNDIVSRIDQNPALLNVQSLTITYLFSLLQTYVSSNHLTLSKPFVSNCIYKIFIENSLLIQKDIDLFSSALQFLNTVILKKPALFLHINHLNPSDPKYFNSILESCISIFKQCNEKFIIKCIVTFWSLLISLKAGDKQDHDYINNIFINGGLGQNLTNVTFSVLLKSTRSNLDLYSDIVRNLIGKYPLQFKTWVQIALALISQQRVQAGKSELKNMNIFIQKLYLAKGSRKTNAIIKDFWLAANGLVDFRTI